MIQLNQRDSKEKNHKTRKIKDNTKLYISNFINKKSDDESDKIDNQILQIDQQCLNPKTRQNQLIKRLFQKKHR